MKMDGSKYGSKKLPDATKQFKFKCLLRIEQKASKEI
jgi:hypothetical protein